MTLSGRCTCGACTYLMADAPLFTHCCHCTWCQRESGSAFALNTLIEADRLTVTGGTPEEVALPSASGRGQRVWRCPTCKVALFSAYSSRAFRFVRVGTLDSPSACPPDVHIYTSTKLPWVALDPATPAFAGYYDMKAQWPAAAQARHAAARVRLSTPRA